MLWESKSRIIILRWKNNTSPADTYLIALDALTGHRIWTVLTRGPDNISGSNTAATLAVKDKVIVGIGGGELGVRGYISAYNLNTGESWNGGGIRRVTTKIC